MLSANSASWLRCLFLLTRGSPAVAVEWSAVRRVWVILGSNLCRDAASLLVSRSFLSHYRTVLKYATIPGVTCLSAHFTFGAVCRVNVIQKLFFSLSCSTSVSVSHRHFFPPRTTFFVGVISCWNCLALSSELGNRKCSVSLSVIYTAVSRWFLPCRCSFAL